jgi:hypothetical protein
MALHKSGNKTAAREALNKALAGKEPFTGRDVAQQTLARL